MTFQVRRVHRQHGTSLIEILIAMVIGLFILGAVAVVFVNMQKTFTSQDQLAQLQDNQRLAQTILTNTVQSAGYFPDPKVNTQLTALTGASGVVAPGQVISGTSGAGTSSDTLTTQFATASGDGVMNCLGQSNTGGSQLVYVNTLSVNANNELQCAVNGQAPVSLVSGVSSLTVLYGTDTDNDGNNDSYLTATQVAAAGKWSAVHAVKVTLNFTTQFGNVPGTRSVPWVQTISLKNQP